MSTSNTSPIPLSDRFASAAAMTAFVLAVAGAAVQVVYPAPNFSQSMAPLTQMVFSRK